MLRAVSRARRRRERRDRLPRGAHRADGRPRPARGPGDPHLPGGDRRDDRRSGRRRPAGAGPARPRRLVLPADRRWYRGWRRCSRSARAHGATTSVDPNWDPAGDWDGGLLELLPLGRRAAPQRGRGLPAGRASPMTTPPPRPRRWPSRAAGGGQARRRRGPWRRRPVAASWCARPRPSAWSTRWTPSAPGTPLTPAWCARSCDGRALDEALAFACACGTLSMRAAGGTAAQPTLAEARAVTRRA